jgi:hypothetical protein
MKNLLWRLAVFAAGFLVVSCIIGLILVAGAVGCALLGVSAEDCR